MFVAGLRRQRETDQPFPDFLCFNFADDLIAEPRLKLLESFIQAFRMTVADLIRFESAFDFCADLGG